MWAFDDEGSTARKGVGESERCMGITDQKGGSRVFGTYNVQLPYYSTNKVHYDYVDCVRFAGDVVCSKSINNVVVIWKPIVGKGGRRGIADKEDGDGVVPLRELVLDEVRQRGARARWNRERCKGAKNTAEELT